VRAFASFDNSGTPATRRERISSGVTWGNAFGADGQLTLQGTVSPDLFESRGGKSLAFEAYTGSLVQPLSRRDTLIAFASYQRAAPSLGANLGQVGKNLQLTTRWARTISSNPKHRTVLTLGYDYKQTNNNLLFGGTSISSQKTDIHQASLDLSVTRPWSGGLFGVSATVTGSPGGIGSRNSTAAFRPTATRSGTPFAKADYVYLRTTATQVTPLGKSGFEARTRFVGQLSSANLLPSEQLSAAGPGVLRGYDPNAAIGTRGFVASQELWTQPISLVSRAGPMADRLQVGAFIEAGQVGNPDRLVAERKWTKTASVGLSAAWSLGPYATLRADYGWQLKALPGTEKGSLGYLTATIGF
jgi:hemolysin activation/secretion protein